MALGEASPSHHHRAATVAIGVGVALARAGRQRLAAGNERARELSLGAGEPVAHGLKRMALEQLDLAIEQLEGGDAQPPTEKAIHETRKALKRLRAMVRLLSPALGAPTFVRETATLREIAGKLAGARDAEVMLATLDALIASDPHRLARGGGARTLREHLQRERDRIRAQTFGDAAAVALVVSELRTCRVRVEAWQLPAGELALAEPGLMKLYTQGRRRYERVLAGRGEQVLAMHEWRKRVKDLRYVAEMLQRWAPASTTALPPFGRAARRRRAKARKPPKLLREVAKRADELGEALGEDHDLAVLADVVHRRHGRGSGAPKIPRRSRKRILKAITRRRRKLRKRTLREGQRLYDSPPKRFVRRVREAARPRRS